jgi:holin-like protein
MLKGLLVLLLFQGIGEVISHYSGIPIPGPVIGMILLFTALQLSTHTFSTGLGEAAHLMIRWLSLLFVPACVGFFFLTTSSTSQWLAIVGVIVLATLVTMVVTATLMTHLLAKKPELKSERNG